MPSAIFHRHFAFRSKATFSQTKPKGVFRQNESVSFVCQNVTGGSSDIFALHIQSSGLLRMEEIPTNGSNAKKKKEGTDRKTIRCLHASCTATSKYVKGEWN